MKEAKQCRGERESDLYPLTYDGCSPSGSKLSARSSARETYQDTSLFSEHYTPFDIKCNTVILYFFDI